jgi:hypothetical protein
MPQHDPLTERRVPRRPYLRTLAAIVVMALLALGLSTAPAAARTTAHSVEVTKTGKIASIKIHVTMDEDDIGLTPAYTLTLKNNAGRFLARVSGKTPELSVGRQTFVVTTTGLNKINPGRYRAELRLKNGRRVVLKQNLGSVKVVDGEDNPPTTQPPTTQPPTTQPPTTRPPSTTRPDPNGSSLLDPALKAYVSGLPTNTAVGVGSTTGLRRPTAAKLPAGTKLNGAQVTVTADGTVLNGWDFTGYRLVVQAQNVTVSGNLFGERTGPADIWDYLLVKANAHNLTIEGNSFFGVDGEGGKARAAIYHGLSGNQTATGLKIRFNRFENLPNDSIKLAGGGAIVQWNAFMLARNINTVPKPWKASTTYNIGDYALNAKGNLFKSTVKNNRGVPVPTSKKGTSNPDVWQSLDPHSDQITVYAAINGANISYNYFATGSRADRVMGTVNAVRLLRNTNTRFQYDRVLVQGNYIEPNRAVGGSALTVGSGGEPNFNGPIEIRHNWIGVRKGGLYVNVDRSSPIWDSNVDAATDVAPPADPGTVVRRTPAPKAAVAPAKIKAGHS